MSYLSTGASALDVIVPLSNPKGLVEVGPLLAKLIGTTKGTVGQDVIKIWAEMKGFLVDKLGPYKLANGQLAIIDGKMFPRMTMSQAQALFRAWFKFSDAMLLAVQTAGISTSRIAQAQARFNGDLITWGLDVSTVYGGQLFEGKYLFAPAVRDLFRIIDRFVIDLSVQAWASVNIETPMERFYEALDETPGGDLLKFPLLAAEATAKGIDFGANVLNGAGKALDNMVEIVKWTAIGGGLFMLYWYVLRGK